MNRPVQDLIEFRVETSIGTALVAQDSHVMKFKSYLQRGVLKVVIQVIRIYREGEIIEGKMTKRKKKIWYADRYCTKKKKL